MPENFDAQWHRMEPEVSSREGWSEQLKAKKPVLGYIALAVAIVGLIGCIPGALILGWVALPIAFILSLVAFFQDGVSKKPAVIALLLAILGLIISPFVFLASLGKTVDDALGETAKVSTLKTGGSDGNTGSSDAGASRENPLPIGSTIESEDWAVTIHSVELNASDAVMGANPFNSEAPEGNMYGLVNISAKYKGNDPQGATPFIGIEYVAANGQTMKNEGIAVAPGAFDSLTNLYEDAETSGNKVIVVPVKNPEQGVLAVRPGLIGDRTFVAVQ